MSCNGTIARSRARSAESVGEACAQDQGDTLAQQIAKCLATRTLIHSGFGSGQCRRTLLRVSPQYSKQTLGEGRGGEIPCLSLERILVCGEQRDIALHQRLHLGFDIGRNRSHR
jgi:hypothetical protein